MVTMILMATSMSAQRISNAYTEARFLTEKMVQELGLSSLQREEAYQANLTYMNGINSYSDISSYAWKQRNAQFKTILTSSQWKRYKNVSYFYRPISWRNNTYVHNVYSKYPSGKTSSVANRNNKPVSLPATNNQRPVETGKTQKHNTANSNKNNGKTNVKNVASSGNRSFGNMR